MATDPTPAQCLILASGSPRREQLMRQAGYAFTVATPPVREPESMGPDVPPTQQAEALSYFKARSVAGQFEEGLVIAADTVVACDAMVFGKPADLDDARAILNALLGKRQEVITGLTLLDAADGRRLIAHDTTVVVMRTLPAEAVEEYLATGAWQGKAGAYGIQDRGDAFVERVEGSFTNVVGLPLELLAAMLRQWGYRLPAQVEQGT
ncbi:MAG: Maf family protein [Planctomycetota bacterium]